jgi:uncharacterized protein DUF6065
VTDDGARVYGRRRGAPAGDTRHGEIDPWPLVAYVAAPPKGFVLEPADRRRAWIGASPHRFVRRCLPLMVANEAGWTIRTPFGLGARWNGADAPGNVEIRVLGPSHPGTARVSNQLGVGLVTFNIPYVFRTPPGVALLVRGPPNFWIAGAHPLEGLVETDWATTTFTMSWRIESPHRWIEFAPGDPVCFLQPISIATVEAAQPVVRPLSDDPEAEALYRTWAASRDAFKADLERSPRVWQKDYYLGREPAGRPVASHRTRLTLAPFTGSPEDAHTPAPRAPGAAATSGGTTPQRVRPTSAYLVLDDFYAGVRELRASAEHDFDAAAQRGAEGGVWDLFQREGSYAYLRTPAERVIPARLVRRYRYALSSWAWENLGVGHVTDPLLSLYVSGCVATLSNDPQEAAYGFVHSLSPGLGFTGGDTLLRHGDSDDVERVAPTFNRLLVFDARLLHGVELVQGSWSPHRGRLVLQGHVRAGGLHHTGGLTHDDAAGALRGTARRLAELVPELGSDGSAGLGVRLDVDRDGEVTDVVTLSAFGAPGGGPGIAADVVDRIIDTLAETRFAGGPGTATFSVPLDDLRCAVPMFKSVVLDTPDAADGVVVTGEGGAAHLNSTARFILECCTGDAGPGEIAGLVQGAFELSSPPLGDVDGCLLDLLGAGLITDASPSERRHGAA